MAHYVVIAGGRELDLPETHADMGEILGFLKLWYGNDLRVLHGAARGVDSVAQRVCETLGITVKAFPADWDGLGKAAGGVRNRQMADLVAKWSKSGHTGELIAFRGIAFRGGSGTENMVKEALERDIPVTRVPHDEHYGAVMTAESPNPQPESTWTPPRDWCPHPDRWHACDSDSTEIEVSRLVAAFVIALQPDFVVETGSAWGQTAEMIGQALASNGQGRLVTLEPDETRAAFTERRCGGLPVTVVRSESLNWTPDCPIGFAWFDSLTDLRIHEFDRYLPFMAPGTIVGFHDTAPHHGIGDAIAAHPRLTTLNLRTPRGVIFGQVLKPNRPPT